MSEQVPLQQVLAVLYEVTAMPPEEIEQRTSSRLDSLREKFGAVEAKRNEVNDTYEDVVSSAKQKRDSALTELRNELVEVDEEIKATLALLRLLNGIVGG